jgi:hypothetical protein
MNDCLRHIDYSLGSPTNTLVACGRYAAQAVYEDTLQRGSWLGHFQAWLAYMHVLARIQIHDLGIWWMQRPTALRLKNSKLGS